MKARWRGIGARPVTRFATSSIGLPFRYFGSTQAPRRVARKGASPIREDSTAMSTPRLPIPRTRAPFAARLGAPPLGAEWDPPPQPVAVGDLVEVGGHLEVVGVVRIALGHRQRLEGHPPPRGVDVQRPIRRRHPVVVFVAPVAADLRPL